MGRRTLVGVGRHGRSSPSEDRVEGKLLGTATAGRNPRQHRDQNVPLRPERQGDAARTVGGMRGFLSLEAIDAERRGGQAGLVVEVVLCRVIAPNVAHRYRGRHLQDGDYHGVLANGTTCNALRFIRG